MHGQGLPALEAAVQPAAQKRKHTAVSTPALRVNLRQRAAPPHRVAPCAPATGQQQQQQQQQRELQVPKKVASPSAVNAAAALQHPVFQMPAQPASQPSGQRMPVTAELPPALGDAALPTSHQLTAGQATKQPPNIVPAHIVALQVQPGTPCCPCLCSLESINKLLTST